MVELKICQCTQNYHIDRGEAENTGISSVTDSKNLTRYVRTCSDAALQNVVHTGEKRSVQKAAGCA